MDVIATKEELLEAFKLTALGLGYDVEQAKEIAFLEYKNLIKMLNKVRTNK